MNKTILGFALAVMSRVPSVRRCAVVASLFLVHCAQAADFFDGTTAKNVSRLSFVGQDITASGYPIYPGDGDWRFVSSTVTGPNPRGGYFGSVHLIHPHAGKYFAEMTLEVNLNLIPNVYYLMDACAGEALLKRSRPRVLGNEGSTSDCLKIEPVVLTISGREITVLLATVSQQNGSRVYELRMALNVETFGFPATVLADWRQDEITRRPDRAKFIEIVGEWAKQLQDASVKAIAYSKPRDAFATVPTLRQLREAVAGTTALPSGR